MVPVFGLFDCESCRNEDVPKGIFGQYAGRPFNKKLRGRRGTSSMCTYGKERGTARTRPGGAAWIAPR